MTKAERALIEAALIISKRMGRCWFEDVPPRVSDKFYAAVQRLHREREAKRKRR